MKLYPESAELQFEFDKIKNLLSSYCETEYAKEKCASLRIHTKKEFIALQLQQAYEYKLLIEQSQVFPNSFSLNLSRQIKLLSIEGSILQPDDFMNLRKLAVNAEKVFRWFDAERKSLYAALAKVLEDSHYEKNIIKLIDEIFDEAGNVKDNASDNLQRIRQNLYKKRNPG